MEFPPEVQLSSVNAVLVTDLNGRWQERPGDGWKPYPLATTIFAYRCQLWPCYPQPGQQEMEVTCLPLKPELWTKGEVRGITEMNLNNNRHFIFLVNNEFPLMYSLNKK